MLALVAATALTALTVGSARHLGIAIVVVLVVLVVVSASVISNVTAKIVTMLLLGGSALGVWTQRANLTDCAERARAKVEIGDTTPTTCTFFGVEVEVPGLDLPDVPDPTDGDGSTG